MSLRRRTLTVAVLSAALCLFTTAGTTGAVAQAPEPSLTLRMIVVGSADAAERIIARVTAGGSFAVIARAESTAPSAEAGGWLGRLPLAEMRPELRRALEGLTPGQISAVVRLPTGFAVFRVEDNSGDAGEVSQALAASGTVKYVLEVSGFGEARVLLERWDRKPGWHLNLREVCDARTRAIATARESVAAFLAPANAADRAARTPLDIMQIHYGMGQLESYEGQMAAAVTQFQEALRHATEAGVPASILQAEEALGIAHMHKAGRDGQLFAAPGEFCLLHLRPGQRVPATADIENAARYFRGYLARKPDELEVRWLLNLAHMALGTYPDAVPPQHLIPASAFQSAEDVGRFRDVAPHIGLDVVMSAGGAIADDFHNTGRTDIVVSTMDNCASMRMFANNGDGTFSDRTVEAGLADQLGGLNTMQGDYNNDGCPDILILRGGWEGLPQRKSLMRNNCRGVFADVTVESGLADVPTSTQTAVWTDIDNDGRLDLFVGNENAPAQLFRNQGDGTFVDIAVSAGVARTAFTKGVTAADYDNDRYPDLFVSNYGGTNFFYRNNGDGTFTEFSRAARVLGTVHGFATWFFDFDNDGWQDLLVTSYATSVDELTRDYLGLPHNAPTMKLYRNRGDGTFSDVSAAAGLDRILMAMGSNFGDIDNDGYLDVFFGTGHPSYVATVGSALLRNKGGRSFVNVTASSGTGELHKGHGVAFADLDTDGDQDIVFEVGGATPGDSHAMRVFENPGHGNDWLAIKLVGVKSNRTAVGARIAVTVEDAGGTTRTIHRAVTSGGSFGASPLQQHVGLGRTSKPVKVEIWWPTSDTRQTFTGVVKNQLLQIEEFAATYTTRSAVAVPLGGARRSR